MNWKQLLLALLIIVGLGIAGFLYRSKVQSPTGPLACTADARVCPDGTSVSRTGPNCTFPACPPPNVELPSAGISFALPAGYTADPQAIGADQATIASYVNPSDQDQKQVLLIREYSLGASTTAADFVRQNAIMDPSGMPAPATAFTSVILGQNPGHRFSVVTLSRFEGMVDTAYYFTRENDVIRFDAISREVTNWTDPTFDPLSLPANQDLRSLLTTLQGI